MNNKLYYVFGISFIVFIAIIVITNNDSVMKNTKLQSSKLKATINDGDNTLIAANSSGELKRSSNNLLVDANVVKIPSKLQIGNWTIEEQANGQLYFYKGDKDNAMKPDKPLVSFSDVDGNIWLNSNGTAAGGKFRESGWISGEMGLLRRDLNNLGSDVKNNYLKLKNGYKMSTSANTCSQFMGGDGGKVWSPDVNSGGCSSVSFGW